MVCNSLHAYPHALHMPHHMCTYLTRMTFSLYSNIFFTQHTSSVPMEWLLVWQTVRAEHTHTLHTHTTHHTTYTTPHTPHTFLNQHVGVGGWADHGVDPGLYSKSLMKETMSAYQKWSTDATDVRVISRC